MVVEAGTRKKKDRKSAKLLAEGIPPDLASRWETIVEQSADRIFNKREAIKKRIGTRPYKGLPVDNAELLGRWLEIRDDPEALTQLLKENSKFKSDGTVRVSKELIQQITQLEKKIKEGGHA